MAAYATAATLKTYLGITLTTDDTLLGTLLDAATATIDMVTHRTFAVAADSTRYFDALGPHIGSRTLYLDRDLCAITSITNGDGVAVSVGQYVTLPANDTPYYGIKLKGSAGKVWTYSSDYEKAITIVGKWGYSTSAPTDIAQACVRLAAFYYRQKDASLMDVTAIEAGVVLRPMGMPKDVAETLERYRAL